MNADGTAQQQLTTPPSGDFDGGASYSPDGTRIAFARFTPSAGTIEIDEINAEGGGLTQIASGNQPSWSPDGAKIALLCGSPLAICTMNADGSNVTKLFQSSINGISSPTWSPDGTRIAFARQHTSGQSILSDVYEMKSDGSGLTQITFVGDVPGGLSWTR
jgi:Tol biopolymer transport system component